MPKKKADVENSLGMEPRTTRRAASRAALQNMARLSASAYVEEGPDDPPQNFTATTDDEEVTIEAVHYPKKKKYSLSHRKSSDGNDRDVLVLKTIAPSDRNKITILSHSVKDKSGNHISSSEPEPRTRTINWNEEYLKLDAWAEDLSPAQLERHNKINREIEEINSRIEQLIKDSSSDAVFQGEMCTAYEIGSSTTSGKTPIAPQPSNITTRNTNNNVQLLMDARSGVLMGTVSQVPQQVQQVIPPKNTRKRAARSTMSPTPTPPSKVPKPTALSTVHSKATESSAIGGLSTGSPATRSSIAAVVDLTADDTGKPAADSKEVSFNKLQGKTFPSLVVVARPHLKSKESNASDRSKLDAKVKSVLMHVPTKFTEWLIQQGLIRSEQVCAGHPQTKLKLGMYSDVSKFPFSGGYVWISDCCPQRFVSVFSGSLFEGSPHAPSVILKLIYHWACQTNVQNVVQWVKVDNLYVKGLNTWLRAACTVALHTYIPPLGGPGVKVEVGVISLGTLDTLGHQRQVKVEVLGLLEADAKKIRLRAVEPLAGGDRNYKKRFSKILEPLLQWVHPESIIVTDLTVDKSTLHSMGFKHVQQSTSSDASNSNHTIMEYLRRIVPRMFQNTLSLLSRQIIQQFLDELVWREWYGVTAGQAFDNMILHLSEQTRTETGHSLILRLNKVAANPFKNWTLKQFTIIPPAGNKPSLHENVQKRNAGRPKKSLPQKPPSPVPELRALRPMSPDVPKQMVPLENYYYGTIETAKKFDTNIVLSMKCSLCRMNLANNVKLMDHLFTHIQSNQHGTHQCHYCLHQSTTKDGLANHIQKMHPPDTRFNDKFACLLCEIAFDTSYLLGEHMSKEHSPSELPYLCGTCGYRCSSHKQAIDHFYLEHDGGNTIQCPFCLKSTFICSNGRMVVQNMNFFLQHLNKHIRKINCRKCNKCNLWFIQKDIPKEHQKLHESVRYDPGLQSWPVPKANAIMVPKSEYDYQDTEEKELDLHNVLIDLPNNLNCKECSASLNKPGHFPTLQSCPNTNCRYTTCCVKSMETHISSLCKCLANQLPKNVLPFTLHCVCGYSNNDGYIMAKHLAVCERKSAYPSAEAAKAATVTHSMLDVLGLVRRSEDIAPYQPSEGELNIGKTTLQVMEIESDEEVTEINATTKKLNDVVEIDDDDDVSQKAEPDDVSQKAESDDVSQKTEPDDVSQKAEPDETNNKDENSVQKDAQDKEKEAQSENENNKEQETSSQSKNIDNNKEEVEKVTPAEIENMDTESNKEDVEINHPEIENMDAESSQTEKDAIPENNKDNVNDLGGETNTKETDSNKVQNDNTDEVIKNADVDNDQNIAIFNQIEQNIIEPEDHHKTLDEESGSTQSVSNNTCGSNDVTEFATMLNETVSEILENSIIKEKEKQMDIDSNLDDILNAGVQIHNLVSTSDSQNNVDMEM